MPANKTPWFRPGYRYAAASACLLISASLAASGRIGYVGHVGHSIRDFGKVIEQTDRDAQLPLERMAVEAGRSGTLRFPLELESQAQAAPATPKPWAASCATPSPRDAAPVKRTRNTRRSTEPVAPVSYRTIRNWKNWT